MKIDAHTKVCGIIGFPLEHTMSPAIHNAAAATHQLNAVFLAFPNQDPKGAIAAMRHLNFLAYSVTIPYKERVMAFLDEIDGPAKKLGNVNTIINQSGKLLGYNTDIDGVELSLKGLRLVNRRVLLLGAGGVAKTIAFVIHKKGGQLMILNRELVLAKKMAKLFNAQANTLDNIAVKIDDYKPHLIINATPVGMNGQLCGQSLVPKHCLHKNMVIFDVIYNPRETKLIKDAKSLGCQVIGGRTMFLGQGARQFELWSGRPAPWAVMEQAFNQNIK